MKVIELNNLCKAQEVDTPLLSNANFDWWEEYITNHDLLDNWFVRMYKNMHYFAENDFTSKEEELTDWLYTVESLLFTNQKKYHELYRIQGIEDDKLSMTENYDMHRSTDSTNENASSNTTGQRSDFSNTLIGEQNFANQNRSTAFNTVGEKVKTSDTSSNGTRNDTNTFTQGQQTNTGVSRDTLHTESHDYGNLGVQTGADILMGYHKAIKQEVFAFYQIVFKDICKELLIWGE